MPNARPRIAAAVIAVATALAACSSGGGSDASPTTRQKRATTATTAAATTTTGAAATTGAQWFTYDHDSARTGVAPDGPASAAAVRRLWASAALDGEVYAQPLVVGDRVIVATANDTVYALNASDGTVAWSTHLGTPVPARSLPCGDVDPVGITGTPVVDVAAGHVYAVGMVQPTRDMLFDLDLASGRLIASTVVDAPGADPAVHNQRAALTLEGNTVYVPYGGRYGDCGNYHGRVCRSAGHEHRAGDGDLVPPPHPARGRLLGPARRKRRGGRQPVPREWQQLEQRRRSTTATASCASRLTCASPTRSRRPTGRR